MQKAVPNLRHRRADSTDLFLPDSRSFRAALRMAGDSGLVGYEKAGLQESRLAHQAPPACGPIRFCKAILFIRPICGGQYFSMGRGLGTGPRTTSLG
jgi:hypothetical protein